MEAKNSGEGGETVLSGDLSRQFTYRHYLVRKSFATLQKRHPDRGLSRLLSVCQLSNNCPFCFLRASISRRLASQNVEIAENLYT